MSSASYSLSDTIYIAAGKPTADSVEYEVRIDFDYDDHSDDLDISAIAVLNDGEWLSAPWLCPVIEDDDATIDRLRNHAIESAKEDAFWTRADYEYERRRDDAIGY